MLVILSGSGKLHLASLLEQDYGFFFLKEKTEELLIQRIQILKKLQSEETNIVVTQSLFKQHERSRLREQFPQAHFILVSTKPEITLSHYSEQNTQQLNLVDCEPLMAEFDAFEENFILLHNENKSRAALKEKIKDILKLPTVPSLIESPRWEEIREKKVVILPSLGQRSELMAFQLAQLFSKKDAHIRLLSPSVQQGIPEDIETAFVAENSEKTYERVFQELPGTDIFITVSEKGVEFSAIFSVISNFCTTNKQATLLVSLTSAQHSLEEAEALKAVTTHSLDLLYVYEGSQFLVFKRSNEISSIPIKEGENIEHLVKDIANTYIQLSRHFFYFYPAAESALEGNLLMHRARIKMISKHYLSMPIFKTIPLVNYENRKVKTLDGRANILISIFKQVNFRDIPTILYFPGTGFTRMIHEVDYLIAQKIAVQTGANVVLVNYRLAPENLFPKALLDAYIVLEYLSGHATELELDDKRFVTLGYSSGATLAALLGILTGSMKIYPIALQVLVSPQTDFSFRHNEYLAQEAADRNITSGFLKANFDYYFPNFVQLTSENVSPYYSKELEHMPETKILFGENDAVRSDNEAFYEKALKAGSRIERVVFEGVDHCGFWDAPQVIMQIGNMVKRMFFDEYKEDNMLDARDLEVTIEEREELNAVNEFYTHFIRQQDDLVKVIALADKYPNCLILQIYAGIVHILSQSTKAIEAGLHFIDRAQALRSKANAREQLYIEAISAGAQNKLLEAVSKYEAIILTWPRDILAGLMVEFHCFELGCYERQLNIWERIEGTIVGKGYPEEHHFFASYAYASELSGNPKKAMELARQALELQPENPWAQHAIAHAYANLNENTEDAIEFLQGHSQDWKRYGDFVRGHNYFHLALFYLHKNDFKIAFEIYKQHVKRNSPDAIYQQSDIIIFLWSLNLVDGLPAELKQAVKEEFKWLYQHASIRELMDQQQLFPFLSLTYVYVCIAVGDMDRAKKITETLMSPKEEASQNAWHIGQAMAKALLAFAEADYAETITLMRDVVHNSHIGGSDEQRSVFIKTFDLAKTQLEFTRLAASVKALPQLSLFKQDMEAAVPSYISATKKLP